MKKNKAGFWAILFTLIAVADIAGIAGIAAGNDTLHTILKPLLMPALAALLFCHNGFSEGRNLVIAGLFFSWIGDVLLMFENKAALFFILGLIGFLMAHLCYILYFVKIRSVQPSLLRQQPWIAALVAGYGVSLVMFLQPRLGDLQIPVTVYAVVICTMLLYSLHVFNRLNRPANLLFVAGALLFTTSDSLLAINKFYHAFAGAGVLIMLTYCAAQFCIVQGVLQRKNIYKVN